MTNKQISQEHQRQSTGQHPDRNTGMQNPPSQNASSQNPSRSAQSTAPGTNTTQGTKSGRDSDRRESQSTSGRDRSGH